MGGYSRVAAVHIRMEAAQQLGPQTGGRSWELLPRFVEGHCTLDGTLGVQIEKCPTSENLNVYGGYGCCVYAGTATTRVCSESVESQSSLFH